MRRQRLFRIGVTLIVKEHIARSASRRHFTKIDRRGSAIFSAQQHKSSAAQIPGLRMRDSQRIAHGDGGIHGITALL